MSIFCKEKPVGGTLSLFLLFNKRPVFLLCDGLDFIDFIGSKWRIPILFEFRILSKDLKVNP
jgi:hypothetical protein